MKLFSTMATACVIIATGVSAQNNMSPYDGPICPHPRPITKPAYQCDVNDVGIPNTGYFTRYYQLPNCSPHDIWDGRCYRP